jgi:hypothetical protein
MLTRSTPRTGRSKTPATFDWTGLTPAQLYALEEALEVFPDSESRIAPMLHAISNAIEAYEAECLRRVTQTTEVQ